MRAGRLTSVGVTLFLAVSLNLSGGRAPSLRIQVPEAAALFAGSWFRAATRAVRRAARAVGHAVSRGARAVGHAVSRGARAVGHAVGRGARAVGHAVGRTAHAVGHAFGRAAHAVGHAVGKAARATLQGIKAVGRGAAKIGRGALNVAKAGAKLVGGALKAGARLTWGSLKAGWKATRGDFKGAFQELGKGARAAGTALGRGAAGAWEDAKTGAGQIVSGALEMATLGLKDRIIALVKRFLASRLFQVAKSMIGKLLGRLGDAIGTSRVREGIARARSLISAGNRILTAVRQPQSLLAKGRAAAIRRLTELAMRVIGGPLRKLAGVALGALLSLGKHLITVPLTAAVSAAVAAASAGIGAAAAPVIKFAIDKFFDWAVRRLEGKLGELATHIRAVQDFLRNRVVRPMVTPLYSRLVATLHGSPPGAQGRRPARRVLSRPSRLRLPRKRVTGRRGGGRRLHLLHRLALPSRRRPGRFHLLRLLAPRRLRWQRVVTRGWLAELPADWRLTNRARSPVGRWEARGPRASSLRIVVSRLRGGDFRRAASRAFAGWLRHSPGSRIVTAGLTARGGHHLFYALLTDRTKRQDAVVFWSLFDVRRKGRLVNATLRGPTRDKPRLQAAVDRFMGSFQLARPGRPGRPPHLKSARRRPLHLRAAPHRGRRPLHLRAAPHRGRRPLHLRAASHRGRRPLHLRAASHRGRRPLHLRAASHHRRKRPHMRAAPRRRRTRLHLRAHRPRSKLHHL